MASHYYVCAPLALDARVRGVEWAWGEDTTAFGCSLRFLSKSVATGTVAHFDFNFRILSRGSRFLSFSEQVMFSVCSEVSPSRNLPQELRKCPPIAWVPHSATEYHRPLIDRSSTAHRPLIDRYEKWHRPHFLNEKRRGGDAGQTFSIKKCGRCHFS